MRSGSSRPGEAGIRIRRRCGGAAGSARGALERLAEADAFRSIGLDRRRALWALKALGDPPLPLFASAEDPHPPSPADWVPPLPQCGRGGRAQRGG